MQILDLRTLSFVFAALALAVTAGCAPQSQPPTLPQAAPQTPILADQVVVLKSRRLLQLLHDGAAFESFPIALGREPQGAKQKEGDGRTPEGVYRIEARNAGSRYHRALRISYPDAAHRARARALGVSPGGDIMIHGLPAKQAWVGAAHRDFDWTEGCIAVTNQEIEEIWSAVPVGTPIHIKP